MKSIIFLLLLFLFVFDGQSQIITERSECKDDTLLSIEYKDSIPLFISATFEGELSTFIKKNLVIPEEVVASKIDDKLYVKVFLDKYGDVIGFVLVKGINECLSCIDSVFDLIKIMPKWKPAYEQYTDGKLVYVQSEVVIEIPFSFNLTPQ